MTINRWSGGAMVVCAVAVTRFLFRSHYLYDIDSVNFALALDHFDPSIYQPHPPGYFLYVCLVRLVNAVFREPNTALVAISILASCGTVVLIARLANEWFGSRASVLAALMFIFSPLAWFYGTVALTYIVEAFFSTLVGYLCWRLYSGSSVWLVPASVALGVAAGFRPSSMVLLGPLWLFSLRRLTMKQVIAGFCTLGATTAAWFIPMVYLSGGPGPYFGSLYTLWRMVPGKRTVFNSNISMSLARVCVVGAILGLCFGVSGLLIFRPRTNTSSDRQKPVAFTWAWICPSLLFFTLFFLSWVNSGYLLALTPPVFCWLGAWAADWYTVRPAPWKPGVIVLAAAANAAIFLWAPLYCSWRSVRSFENELKTIQTALPQVATPRETLIVGFDSHFLGYRHAAYYLPDYLTLQYPEVALPQGTRVFAVQARRTCLLTRIPIEQFKTFVLFPLPGGDIEYEHYLAKVRTRFSDGALHSRTAEGRTFLIGSTKDLHDLFPSMTLTPTPL